MKLQNFLDNVRYMQYLSAFLATLSVANSGMYITWSSPSLPKLQSETESPLGRPLTVEEQSWVVSCFLLGTAFGAAMSGYFLDKLGRKWVLLMSSVPLFFPWIVVYFTKSVYLLIAMRTIAGMGGGLILAGVPVYTGEITDKDIRGRLGSFFNLMKQSGSIFVLSVGPFLSYGTLTLVCSVFPLIFTSAFIFMPESPYYLMKEGKKELALKNVTRLASKNVDKVTLQNNMDEIENTIDYDMKNKSTMWEFVSKQEYRKSIYVMLGVKTLQQFSGMNAIDPYLQTIVESSGSSISKEVSSILCGVVQIPAVLFTSLLVDKLGRKPLLIFSALGCSVALIAEGVFFYLKEVSKADVSSIGWLPTGSLILYLIMNPIGVFTLPFVLLGEMFATNIKGSAATFMSVYGSILGFLVSKYFATIYTAWGMYTMFWFFAGCCILGAIFVFFYLPETKGKTFLEIQQKLNRKKEIV